MHIDHTLAPGSAYVTSSRRAEEPEEVITLGLRKHPQRVWVLSRCVLGGEAEEKSAIQD